MKILTQQEAEGLKYKFAGGRGRSWNEDVYIMLEGVRLNESLFVGTEDWNGKSAPISNIVSMAKTHTKKGSGRFAGKAFSGRTLIDESGWVFTRYE